MLANDNFTENFDADVPVGILQNVSNDIHSCFCWRIYQLLLKVISLLKKVQGVWFFEETNRNNKSKFLLDTLQSVKKKTEKRNE